VTASPPDPTTLNELFFSSLDRFGARPVLLRWKQDGTWREMSYQELLSRVQALSLGLADLGVQPGDRVAIISENRPEWAITDYACLTARCADVPIYPTLPAKQVEYILRDSNSVAVFASSSELLEKAQAGRARLPALRHVIAFDAALAGGDVLSFDSVLERGRRLDGRAAAWRAEALRVVPDDLATQIYTSGTTGEPKGVMLTHRNITTNVVAGIRILPLTPDDECLSFLPLSHIFERMAGHYCMMLAGTLINYASSIDAVAAEMLERRPTVVLSVPRLFEKSYARVLEGATSGSARKRAIFTWARRKGERWVDLTLAGRPVPPLLAMQHRVAHALVFSKLHARVGGRLRFFVSGGAPLSPEIAKFFFAAGLPILEGYGLTETSPVIAVNGPGRTRLGTVGKVLPGVEVKIAEDGEILTRGPHVMKGYYNKPEDTAAAIDADGWFHTGDIGILDVEGYLSITDRKKDLIVTAGGKNIAPQPIEELAKSSKFVSSAVMLGDKRRFPIMLVVPDFGQLRAWATYKGLAADGNAALLALPPVKEKLDREVKKTLRDLAHFEIPKKLLLLPNEFSIEGGELTPKMSVRRRVVEKRYEKEIEALYAEEPAGVAPRD
jgi:long-chain acyl-CoA synthetase